MSTSENASSLRAGARQRRTLQAVLLLCGAALAGSGALTRSAAGEEPPLTVAFQGLLPGNVNPRLEGEFQLELRIYLSPQGGQPVWRETQTVRVVKGQIDIQVGARTPIPMEIHEANYKWLGASVTGQREIFPRYPIVNVVYASPREALLAQERRQAERRGGQASAAGPAPAGGAAIVEGREEPLTWKAALDAARARGQSLPDYRNWYGKLATLSSDAAAGWTGHYEWVLPWVYDTASHGGYNDLFRGRFQGCDYSDLSPQKKYPFRLAAPASQPAGAKPENATKATPEPATQPEPTSRPGTGPQERAK